MSARVGQSLATLFVGMPLACGALAAIFGIPQFAPVIASPDDQTVVRQPHQLGRGGSSSRFESSMGEESDWFEDAPPFEASEPTASHQAMGSSPTETRPASSSWFEANQSAATAQHSRDPYGQSAVATTSALAAGTSPAGTEGRAETIAWSDSGTATPQRATLTWREASLKLTELGIQKYHLERGHESGMFLFVCMFAPGDDPHVLHRFEAESPDPLVAVNAVIAQVDEWLQARYASAGSLRRTAGL